MRMFPLAILGPTLATVLLAQAQDYVSLIAKARELIQADQTTEALTVAKRAIKARPKDHKGYYYAALALFKADQLDLAQPYLDQCRKLCPPENLPTVEKLAKAITGRRASSALIQEGDSALAQGLIAKAAQAYAKAWEADDQAPEAALKAAGIYLDRLQQPLEAAPLLREVMERASPAPSAEEAQRKLAGLKPKLREIAKKDHDAGRAAKTIEASKRWYQESIRADPEYTEAYGDLAYLGANSFDTSTMVGALREMAKRNALTANWLLINPGFHGWILNPEFSPRFAEILGARQLDDLQTKIRTVRDTKTEIIKLSERNKGLAASLDQRRAELWSQIIERLKGLEVRDSLNPRSKYWGKITQSFTITENYVQTFTETNFTGPGGAKGPHPERMILNRNCLGYFICEKSGFENLYGLRISSISKVYPLKGNDFYLYLHSEDVQKVSNQLILPILEQKKKVEIVINEMESNSKQMESLKYSLPAELR